MIRILLALVMSLAFMGCTGTIAQTKADYFWMYEPNQTEKMLEQKSEPWYGLNDEYLWWAVSGKPKDF